MTADRCWWGGVRSLAKALSPFDLQDEFSADICRLLVAPNTGWVTEDKPGLRWFTRTWLEPEVMVQDRRTQLNKEFQKVEESIRGGVRENLVIRECGSIIIKVIKSSVVGFDNEC